MVFLAKGNRLSVKEPIRCPRAHVVYPLEKAIVGNKGPCTMTSSCCSNLKSKSPCHDPSTQIFSTYECF